MIRHIIPFAEWPEIDRMLWEKATQKADFLGEDGCASSWKGVTSFTRVKSYGAFLQFLNNQHLLDIRITPADRITQDVVICYYQYLDARGNSSITIYNRLRELMAMLQAMQPGKELSELAKLVRRTKRRAKPTRAKYNRLMHPGDILSKLLDYLDESKALAENCTRKKSTLYRDALAIALLTSVPIRLKNLTALRVDKEIVKNNGSFDIALSEYHTKTLRPYSGGLPEVITPYMDHYLRTVRPLLLEGRSSEHLWISYRHGPISEHTMRENIKKLTLEVLNHEITPHLFRDIAVTFLVTHLPENVRAASTILGHTKIGTTEAHYNQAKMLQAVREFQDSI